jgi:hypothetical protein
MASPTTIQLLRQLDTKTIAVLGEDRVNLRAIHQTRHQFSLAEIVPGLLVDNPECGVWISGGSPQLAPQPAPQPEDPSIPTLNLMVVPGEKSPPPYVAYSVKDELQIISFSEEGLSWSMVAPRVHILKSHRRLTQRSIQIMTVDERAAEEHTQLFTVIPRVQLQVKANGEIDVRFANFVVLSTQGGGGPIYESNTNGDGLQGIIDQMVEDYGAVIGGDDPAATVKTIIEEGLVAARALVGRKERLEADGYDATLLDQIKTIKLYPKDTVKDITSDYVNKYYPKAVEVKIAE